MKPILSAALLLGIVAALPAGGAASHEALVKRMLAALEDLGKTLGTIKNQETAAAAKPELRKTAQDWVALREETEKAPPPSREEKTRLEKEYKDKLERAQKRLFGEVTRVQNIPGGPDALKEIRGVLARQVK